MEENSEKDTRQYLSLEEYQKIAQNYLIYFVTKGRHASNLINNQDAVDMIINFMLKADTVFDGRGCRWGFRYQYAKFGFGYFLRKNKGMKFSKVYKNNFSSIIKKKKDQSIICDVAIDKIAPYSSQIDFEFREKIRNADNLSDREKEIIFDYYYNENTREQIAKKFNCSRQLIDLTIKKACYKLQFILPEYK